MKAKDGSNHGTLPLLTTLIKTHHDTPVFRIPLCRSLAREMLLLSRASLRRLRIRMIRPSSRARAQEEGGDGLGPLWLSPRPEGEWVGAPIARRLTPPVYREILGDFTADTGMKPGIPIALAHKKRDTLSSGVRPGGGWAGPLV
jgi:hypothetical protein